MKKTNFKTALAMAALALAIPTAALAWDDGKTTWVDFHSSKTPKAGVGVGKNVVGDIWASLRMDNLGAADYSVSVDALYAVPMKFLIFDIYGGVGVDYTPNTGETGAHIVAGSKFWLFFTEAEYRLVTAARCCAEAFDSRFNDAAERGGLT